MGHLGFADQAVREQPCSGRAMVRRTEISQALVRVSFTGRLTLSELLPSLAKPTPPGTRVVTRFRVLAALAPRPPRTWNTNRRTEEKSLTYVINGPNGGNATIFGNTSGDDIINAFDYNNVIISGGANDQIYTGSGGATVNLGAFVGVTDTVNLGGGFNTVFTPFPGHFNSSLTVQGGTGHNNVTLNNLFGVNSVALQGFYNKIVVNSDATNIIFTGAGHNSVVAGKPGDGNTGFQTTINEAGTNNTVVGGDQNFMIVGGQGYDAVTLGNGNNTITESGLMDRITVGTGNNTITDFGGGAIIHFVGKVIDDPLETNIKISLGGTNNFVMEDQWALGSGRDFTINGGTGNGTFILGDGEDNLTTSGDNNYIRMGTPNNLTSPYDILSGESGDSVTTIGFSNHNTILMGDGNNTVWANGDNNTIALGNGSSTVNANGNSDKITVGNGNNKINANGTADTIVGGNGANTVTANGNGDFVTLGNGPNALTANGDADLLKLGNGANNVTAGGNGDGIVLGTGNNTVAATGNNDVITSAGGKGTFTIGSSDSLTLNASSLGTTVNSLGTANFIDLAGKSNAAITDSPSGGSLTVKIDASAGSSGKISVAGFQNDPLGSIDLHGFAGITNYAQLMAVSSSDGAGGTLIHLGTGSLDLLATATLNSTQFTYV